MASIHLAQSVAGYSYTCIECGEAHNTSVPIANHVCIHLVQSSLVCYERWQPAVTLTPYITKHMGLTFVGPLTQAADES